MSRHGRRLDTLEAVYQRPEAPRLLITERTPDGRLVRFGTDEEVHSREQDEVIVFAIRGDGPQ